MVLPTIDISTITPIQEFADLADCKPCLHGIPEANWTPAMFGMIPKWGGIALDEAQAISVGRTWLENIQNTTISTRTAIQGLKLALSLPSMNRGSTNRLLIQQTRGSEALPNMLAVENLPSIEQFSGTPFSVRAERGEQQSVYYMTPPVKACASSDSNAQQFSSYCFLAAYLMKLIAKAPENITSGVNNMKSRYLTSYGLSAIVSNFEITTAQALVYKEALLSEAMIALTYTHSIAYTHQAAMPTLNEQETDILCYLCFLPLSYTGMHAYTLMMELENFTELPLGRLLSLFYASVTAPALKKIAQIVTTYERTIANPDRDVTFRYCTHWGSQYFKSVRSRQCTHLLYTVACAWKSIASGNQNADPEKIAAVRSLPAEIKRKLKLAGEIIGESLKQELAKQQKREIGLQ